MQILFTNRHIRNSGTGLTTLGSHLIILTHASTNLIIKPKRGSVLLLKRSICLRTLTNQTEPFKWCYLRKVFTTSSSFFSSFFPFPSLFPYLPPTHFFLRHKRLPYWNSLHTKKISWPQNTVFTELKKQTHTKFWSYIVALEIKLTQTKDYCIFSFFFSSCPNP